MFNYLAALASALVLFYCAFVVGRAVLLTLAIKCRSWEMEAVLSVPTGFGFLALITYLLGRFHLLSPWIFAAIMIGIILGGLFLRPRGRRRIIEQGLDRGGEGADGLDRSDRSVRIELDRVIHMASLALIVAAALLLLVRGLSPIDDLESGGDEMRYYASMSRQYLASNSTDILRSNPTASAQPQTAEMLFLWGMSLAGDSFPKLFSALVLLFVGFGVYSAGKDVLRIRQPALGAALFLAAPFTLSPMQGLAHSRPLLVLFVFVSMYALCRWVQEPDWRLACLMGILAGFAMGTQTLGIPLALVIGLAILLRMRGQPATGGLRNILSFALAAMATAGLWYVRSVLETGSPVYPYFTGIWPPNNAYWNEFLEFRIGNHARGRSDALFAFQIAPVAIGQYLLPFLPAILLLRQRGHIRATRYMAMATFVSFAGAILLVPGLLAGELRYAYQLFPMLGLLAASAFGSRETITRKMERRIPVVIAALFLMAWSIASPINGPYLTARFLQVTQGTQLSAGGEVPIQRKVLEFANSVLPAGSAILSTMDAQQFFSALPVVQAQTSPVASVIYRSTDMGTILASLRSAGITHIIQPEYVEATATEVDRDIVLLLSENRKTVLRPVGEEAHDGWLLYEINYDSTLARRDRQLSDTRIRLDLSDPDRIDPAWKITPSDHLLKKFTTSWTVWQVLQDHQVVGEPTQYPALLTYRVRVEASGRYELWGLDFGTGKLQPYGLMVDGVSVESLNVGRRASSYQWRRSSSLLLQEGEHTVGVILPPASGTEKQNRLKLVGLFLEPEGSGFRELAESRRAGSDLVDHYRLTVDRNFHRKVFRGEVEGFSPQQGGAGDSGQSWLSWSAGRSSVYFPSIPLEETKYQLVFLLDSMPERIIGRRVGVHVNGHEAGSFVVEANKLTYLLSLQQDWLKGQEIEVFFYSESDPQDWWLLNGGSMGIPIRSISIERSVHQ